MSTQQESHVFGSNRRTAKWPTVPEEDGDIIVVDYVLTHAGPGGSCHHYAADMAPFGLPAVTLVAPDLMAARRLGSEAVEKALVEHGWLSQREEK